MKILIHINATGPIGAWRVYHNSLESYYDSIATAEEKDGAERLITLKTTDPSWDNWFARLVSHSPYFAQFELTDAPTSQALSDTLVAYQATYNGL